MGTVYILIDEEGDIVDVFLNECDAYAAKKNYILTANLPEHEIDCVSVEEHEVK